MQSGRNSQSRNLARIFNEPTPLDDPEEGEVVAEHGEEEVVGFHGKMKDWI